MSNDAEEPESKAGQPKPPKMKAGDNPWYLLATLYDQPNVRRPAENRRAWNKYHANWLDDETRARLIEEKRHPADELTPLLPEEQQEVERAFAERSKASVNYVRFPKHDSAIKFDDVRFNEPITFKEFPFIDCSFEGAVFSSEFPMHFDKATFCGAIKFKKAIFRGEAYFGGASFRDTYPLGWQTDLSGATSFLRHLLMTLRLAGRSPSMAQSSRVRPGSGWQLSRIEQTSRTQLSLE